MVNEKRLIDANAMKSLIRCCPHCKKPVIPSEVPGYVWQCLECDEDFYDIECYKVKRE